MHQPPHNSQRFPLRFERIAWWTTLTVLLLAALIMLGAWN